MKTASGDGSAPGSEATGGGGQGLPAAADPHPTAGADPVLLPVSQHTLTDATYHRDGADLVLVDGDGARLHVPNFFAHAALPDLTTPDGASLPGDLAAALAGQPAHGHAPMQLAENIDLGHQLAQVAGASKLQEIGRVDVIEGTVTATHVDGAKVVLAKGDTVFMHDLLESQPGGTIGLVLAALFFGTLAQGGLAINAHVPMEAMDILQGVVIVAVALADVRVRSALARGPARAAA